MSRNSALTLFLCARMTIAYDKSYRLNKKMVLSVLTCQFPMACLMTLANPDLLFYLTDLTLN